MLLVVGVEEREYLEITRTVYIGILLMLRANDHSSLGSSLLGIN